MTRKLHIALALVLGLAVLGGCRREVQPEGLSDIQQVEGQPVQVNLTLDIRGFGSDGVVTKADYEDVPNSLIYEYEKSVSDYAIFVFDATNAYKDDGNGKFIFDPTLALRLPVDEEAIAHKEQLGTLTWRHELHLSDTYKSLAVLVLANMGDATYTNSNIPGAGSSLQAVADSYYNHLNYALTYQTDQGKYVNKTVRLPMYGFQLYGSLEGLETTASAAKKAEHQLKYYSGMSTPLTVKGFQTADELNSYVARGAVRVSDRLDLRHIFARLRVSYVPAAAQPAVPTDPVTPGVATVEITGVRLKNYDSKVRVLPPLFSGVAQVTPLTDLPAPLSLNTTNEITFVHPAATDRSWVAYVPEIKVTGGVNDPKLIVDVKVTDKDGNIVTYTFDRDQIRRKDSLSNDKTYVNTPWTEWLQMRTYYTNLLDTYAKKKPGTGTTADIPLLTYYNLVRNYAYEWVAYGVEGMKL